MPSITVFPPPAHDPVPNPLPNLLQTPFGYALVELQGTIHTPPTTLDPDTHMDGGSSKMQDMPVGKLFFPLYNSTTTADDTAWMKRVYLYIGNNQRLTGQVKKLPKALALLKRKADSEEEALEIAGIIKYKIAFAERPEPVGDE